MGHMNALVHLNVSKSTGPSGLLWVLSLASRWAEMQLCVCVVGGGTLMLICSSYAGVSYPMSAAAHCLTDCVIYYAPGHCLLRSTYHV